MPSDALYTFIYIAPIPAVSSEEVMNNAWVNSLGALQESIQPSEGWKS